jgi:glycosyltransferase involved in cell wall biosynthesis
MPTVTVLTMCHNYARFLPECIDSVRAQTYKDYEHILIDAGSEDDSWEVIRRYAKLDTRIIAVKIEDRGLCSSRNHGLLWAHGQYVTNLDADDKLHPRFLERLLAKAGPKTLVCPGLQEFEGGTGCGWPSWGTSLLDFLDNNRIFCCSMFPLQDFREVGGYDTGLDWMGYEDWELWIRLLKNGCRVEVVPEILFYHRGCCTRGHEASSSRKRLGGHEERVQYIRSKHGTSSVS